MVWEAMGESWEMSREEGRGCTRDWEGSERGEDEESGLEGVVSGLEVDSESGFDCVDDGFDDDSDDGFDDGFDDDSDDDFDDGFDNGFDSLFDTVDDSETDDSFFDSILDIIDFDSSFDFTGVDIFDPTVTSSPPPDRFTAPRGDTRS